MTANALKMVGYLENACYLENAKEEVKLTLTWSKNKYFLPSLL